MCDTLIKTTLTKNEIPRYVYKRVQKVGNGKYVTPVMGEPLYKGSWKGAKSYPRPAWNIALVNTLITKFQKWEYGSSSIWANHHVGRWASFRYAVDARRASLNSNFVDDNGDEYPPIIVKCEIRGNVSLGNYHGKTTFLSSQIRVVEEVDN